MVENPEIASPTQDFMTIPRFLEFINQNGKVLSREFVYRMAKLGRIPIYRIGKKIFVKFDEVLAALRQD